MGQTLSYPATQKVSESGGNGRFLFSVSEMQGWRISMEDAHAIVLDLDGAGDDANTFFAVYDGHGGGMVARFAGEHVHKRLVGEETYQKKEFDTALKRAFLGTDEDILANPAHARDPSGCTAVAALVTNDNKIYVANAGDSRSVISVKGEVKPLSFDHKPSNEVEKTRIAGAGGFIEYGRVNGNLALSRALGDFEFKKNYSLGPEKQIITADPDVTCHEITEEDEFLILACDGIWDCLTSQQVVDFVRYKISEGKELSEIGEAMCEHCLAPDTSSGAGIGCDNMTIMIVALLHGRTKEEWYSWITDRVKNGYGYQTPSTVPQLYAQSRLISFNSRRESMEARTRAKADLDDNASGGLLGNSALSGFARVLGSTGGISFHPGAGILSDSGALMFGGDGSDDDDDSDEDIDSNVARSFFSDTLGLGHSESPDPTSHLKAELADYEKDGDGGEHEDVAMDGTDDERTAKSDSSKLQGEAPPPPPQPLPNGDAKVASEEQLKTQPSGDELSPVVKAEGLLDSSEGPLKV